MEGCRTNPAEQTEQNDADAIDPRTMTNAYTLYGTGTANTVDHEDSETRDKTNSADSEGASTIKATKLLTEEAPQPVT